MIALEFTELNNPLQRKFVKMIFKSTRNELYEALATYRDSKTTSEVWAQNVIKREIARREKLHGKL